MKIIKDNKREHYTTINNKTVKDKNLGLRALGLHIFLLSQSEKLMPTLDWLQAETGESKYLLDKLLKYLQELGYLERIKGQRDKRNRYICDEWIVYESPKTISSNSAKQKPKPISPSLENSVADNQALINNHNINNQEINDVYNINQSINHTLPIDETDVYQAEQKVKEQIDYKWFRETYPNDGRIDDIAKVIRDIYLCTDQYIRIGGQEYETKFIKNEYAKIKADKIVEAVKRIDEVGNPIKNPIPYWRKVLLNIGIGSETVLMQELVQDGMVTGIGG